MGSWYQLREMNKMRMIEPAQTLCRKEGEILQEYGLYMLPLMMYGFLKTKVAQPSEVFHSCLRKGAETLLPVPSPEHKMHWRFQPAFPVC